MSINFLSKAVSLFVFSTLLLVSCRTEPKIGTENSDVQFKHAGSKTVYVGLPVQVKTLNPIAHRAPYAEMVYSLAIQPLMDVDLENYTIVPVLAQSAPEVNDITEGKYAGGISYTYQIKEGAVWDNGSPVTAKDVEFSVKVAFAPKVYSPLYPYYYADIKDIQMDENNPKRVTFILDRKYFLGEEATAMVRVLPEYIYDAKQVLRKFSLPDLIDKEKNTALAQSNPELIEFAEEFNSPKYSREVVQGSGPYKFEEWETGQRLVLSRKKDWWGDKYKGQNNLMSANPDTVFFRVITDQTALAIAVRNEDVDAAFGLNVQDFKDLQENENIQKLYDFHSPPTFAFYFSYLNTKSPLLTDKRVRRALAHLTDVDVIIKNLYNDMAQAQPGPISPLNSTFNKSLKQIPYDLEKAKALLKEAGWTDTDGNGVIDKEIDGKQVEMRLRNVSSDTKFAKDLGAYLEDSYKDAGIIVESEFVEFNLARQRQNKRDFDISSAALGGSPFPTDYAQIYHTSADNPSGANRSGFGSAASDEILEKIQVTLSEEERQPLFYAFQEMLYDEQPKIYFFSPKERIVISKRLQGEGYGYKPFIHAPSLQFANAK